MLIRFRSKSYPSREILGLPVEQWTVRTDEGNKVRIFVLVPTASKLCDVEVLCEERDEWILEGTDSEFCSRSLKDTELDHPAIASKQIEEDLYYVWDDGASQHLESAERLYDAYCDAIDRNIAQAKSIQQEAFNHYAADAQKNGWDTTILPEAGGKNPYGPVGPKTTQA